MTKRAKGINMFKEIETDTGAKIVLFRHGDDFIVRLGMVDASDTRNAEVMLTTSEVEEVIIELFKALPVVDSYRIATTVQQSAVLALFRRAG